MKIGYKHVDVYRYAIHREQLACNLKPDSEQQCFFVVIPQRLQPLQPIYKKIYTRGEWREVETTNKEMEQI